jgi:hypothetical protein
MVPFLCFFPSRAWLFFTGAVIMAYWTWVPFRATGQWGVAAGLLAVEYVPFYVMLAYEGFVGWRRRNLRNP